MIDNKINNFLNKVEIRLVFIIVLLLYVGCTGINLPYNCGKESVKIIVLPFHNDTHLCNFNVEKILSEMCYDIVNYQQYFNEYSHTTGKSISEVTIEEFAKFVNSRGIHKVVIGDASVVYLEGSRRPDNMITHTGHMSDEVGSSNNPKSLDYDMYVLVTGNYVQVNCYIIDTETLEQKQFFRNYKVKKIYDGTPTL